MFQARFQSFCGEPQGIHSRACLMRRLLHIKSLTEFCMIHAFLDCTMVDCTKGSTCPASSGPGMAWGGRRQPVRVEKGLNAQSAGRAGRTQPGICFRLY